jgi:uncharacterized integral membrane protein
LNPQTKNRLKIAAVIITVIILLIILLQNTEPTTLRILLAQYNLPLVAWLLIILAIGFVLGFVCHSLWRRRKLAPREKKVA